MQTSDGFSKSPPTPQELEELKTVAEASDFKSTSLSQDVVEYVEKVSDAAEHVQKFVFGKTNEGRDMVGAVVAREDYELGQQDDRNVVLLLGNIHSGECAGKEALLQMLRELALDPNHRWLNQHVIVFVPNYSADANDQVGKLNRPGQVGPENGMGRRANAQELDLNRDFVKIESPEARSLVSLIDKINPHMFVDCHTTNGSKHQYALTYDIPHNPATSSEIREFMRGKMMPELTKSMEAKNIFTFYYGNFNREHTKWATFGHQPRYSTEYVGLRGRMAILSEAYSYITYKERIDATHAFVSSILDYMSDNAESIHQMVDAVEADLIKAASTEPERVAISLDAKPEAFPEKMMLKGYKDDEPHEYECEFISDYKATKETTLPFGYLIPTEQIRVVDHLRMHGVSIEQLESDTELEVEIDTVTDLTRNETAFQKHKMLRVESDRETQTQMFSKGTYVVKTAQPLGRLIAYMLEVQSDDGFVFWNFLDDSIEKGQPYPIARIAKPIGDTELKTKAVTELSGKLPIKLSHIDGPSSLFAESTPTPRWFGDTNMIKTKVYGREMLLDPETNAFTQSVASFDKTIFEGADLDSEIVSKLTESDPTTSTNGKSAFVTAEDYTVVCLLEEKTFHTIGTPENKAELMTFNPDESAIAFVNNDGLNFFEIATEEVTTMKADDEKHLVGKLDWVYQEELYGRGNFKGFWWHPDGKQVAFLYLDESPLIPFTVMDHVPIRGKSEFTNYPKAGDPNPTVKVGVLNYQQPENNVWVDLSNYEDDILVTQVTWSKDGTRLAMQVQNRVQTWLDLVTTDPNGSDVKRLFRDQTPAWIDSPGDPIFLPDGSFLWVSPRSGYRHLYRYDVEGNLLDQITDGEWEIRSLLGLDEAKENFFFTSAKDSAIDLQLYRLNLESKEVTQLTKEPGVHRINFSDDKSFFLDTFSDVNTMPKTTVCRADGTQLRTLGLSSDDRFKYLEISKPEFVTVPMDNGQPMDGMLIYPPDFDRSKKYPLFVHMYGGPQAPRVKNRFGGQWYLWHQMLAQQGYVVWIVDNQSCSHRSTKHVWPVHRNFAEAELADIRKSIDWVKEKGWVDESRIGLWGWSYGGYMTAYAMTRCDDFKMGISGAPVTDWANYDSIYTERYMGLPSENAEGYRSNSVLDKAADLSGKLLLVHGTIDDNVHLNNSIQFIDKLQKAGKQFEMMIYPGSRHSVRNKQQLAHLRELMTKFVLENL